MTYCSPHNCYNKAASSVQSLCLLLLGVFTHLASFAQISATEAIEMGRSAMFYDDYMTAVHYFSTALEARPYLSEAYYNRATANFNMAEYTEAEKDLDKAIEFNPFHVEYYQLRGLCRIHNERYEGAVEDYSQVVIDNPEDQSAYYNRALCLYELKDYAQADAELDYIIHRWPRFARAYVVKAQTCLELKDTLKGLYWIDSLLVMSKKEPNAWFVKANYALRHRQYTLADSCYSQALRYDAGCAEYYMGRARSRCGLKRYDRAIDDYGRVIGMERRHTAAYYNRGLVHMKQGESARAYDDFCRVVELESENKDSAPQFPEAKRYKALLENTRRNKQPYFSDAELLAQLSEDETFVDRSLMEEFKGRVQNQKKERVFLPQFHADGHHLQVEGGRHPVYSKDEHFLELINKTNVESGANVQEAITALQKYLEYHFEDAIILYNLGCLEVEGGSLEEAEKAFTRASELDPLMPEAYYNKGVIYLLQNKRDLAEPLLKKAGEMGVVKAFNMLKLSKR